MLNSIVFFVVVIAMVTIWGKVNHQNKKEILVIQEVAGLLKKFGEQALFGKISFESDSHRRSTIWATGEMADVASFVNKYRNNLDIQEKINEYKPQLKSLKSTMEKDFESNKTLEKETFLTAIECFSNLNDELEEIRRINEFVKERRNSFLSYW